MTPTTPRAPVVLVLVWLAGVVVATGIGVLAVRLVAAQVGDPAVPSISGDVAPTAAGTPAPSGTSAGSPPPRPSPVAPAPAPGTSRSFRSAGGTLGVECTGSSARLVFATPAEGYALDERSVAGSEVEVRFEAGRSRVRLGVSCASGRPVLVEERTDARGSDDD